MTSSRSYFRYFLIRASDAQEKNRKLTFFSFFTIFFLYFITLIQQKKVNSRSASLEVVLLKRAPLKKLDRKKMLLVESSPTIPGDKSTLVRVPQGFFGIRNFSVFCYPLFILFFFFVSFALNIVRVHVTVRSHSCQLQLKG